MTSIGFNFARPEALLFLLAIPVASLLGFTFHKRHRHRRAPIALRLAAIALLIIAIAEPLHATNQSEGATIFVVDDSASLSDSTLSGVQQWVDNALESAGQGDRAAIIRFSDSPVLTGPANNAHDMTASVERDGSAQSQSATNIESALAMAQALPVGGSRRIVLVSDGSQNDGEVLNQVSQAATNQIPIDVLPVDGIGMHDFRILDVSAPASIWAGDSATLSVTVFAKDETKGNITVLVDGQPEQEDVAFAQGVSSHQIVLDSLEPGFHDIEIQTIPESSEDRYVENNSAPMSIMVRASPNLLVVSPDGTDSTFLGSALERQGATVSLITPDQVPTRLSEISTYDVVILNNVPASQLTVAQVAGLDAITREFGRGLVVLGGTAAYGPGGYADTSLEDMLPVTVKVTEGKARQRVALMLIIDKSGSMSSDPTQSGSKVEMAQEAARLATGALMDGDEIGILVFNDSQQWIVHLTSINGAEDRNRINAAIDNITSEGGTEIYPALNVGFDEMSKSDAGVRHVVLLSDGKSTTGSRESFQKLIAGMRGSNTSLSTIAIGDDADTDLLQFLAEQGNGNYLTAETPEDIPILTLAEAQNAGSQSVVRGDFTPLQTSPSPIMTNFDPETLPSISGVDYADARSDAQVVLSTPREDPLLAKWQYGLGRVVAWTADDGIDFARDWRSWDRYGEFWTAIVRWSLPDPENSAITVKPERDGNDTLVRIEATGDVGDYIDLSDATMQISSRSGSTESDVPLYQVAPNEYEIRVADAPSGAYHYSLIYAADDGEKSAEGGFTVPVSRELQPSGNGGSLMETIAARTGGRVLTMDDADIVFDGSESHAPSVRAYSPIWWIPAAAALLLLILEIGIRTGFLTWNRLRLR